MNLFNMNFIDKSTIIEDYNKKCLNIKLEKINIIGKDILNYRIELLKKQFNLENDIKYIDVLNETKNNYQLIYKHNNKYYRYIEDKNEWAESIPIKKRSIKIYKSN